MVKLRVMESLPDGIREGIGVQFRGPTEDVKKLHDRWDREHAAQPEAAERKAI